MTLPKWPVGTQFKYFGIRMVVLKHFDMMLCHYVDFQGVVREVAFPDDQLAAVKMVATPGWDS